MNHNWNLIPPIVDLLDGHFEIIFLPFFLDIELKDWVPRAPLSSLNLIPISCIKNLDSAIISWTMLFALLANVQCADRSSSFLLLIQAMMVFFCSCNCELAASRSFCTLLHTTHCCDDLLPTRWQLGIPTSTILWLGVPHHLQKESRYTWLWKVISLQHYIPLKGRNKESELSLC